MVKALEKFDKEEYQEAFVLLVPLSEAGNPRAQRCLADMYHLGLGVERDGVKAAELYLRVGEKNIMQDGLSAVAYNNLATLYFGGGPGIERDLEKGRQYLERARELGFPM